MPRRSPTLIALTAALVWLVASMMVITAGLITPAIAGEHLPEKATITLESASRAELEAVLMELKKRASIRVVKVDYAANADKASVGPSSEEQVAVDRALKKREPVRLDVELTSIRYDNEGKGIFTTATGTVWRETVASPTRSRLDPKRTYRGVITTGLIGGYRLNVEGVVRELKVEPIRAP